MNVLGILATPNRMGKTALLLEQTLEGARKSGAETAMLFLDEYPAVWTQKQVREVGQSLKKADCLVIATPTYWGGMSGILKSFFDALRAYFVHTTSNGEIIPHFLKGKAYISITSCYQSRWANLFGGVTNPTFNQMDDILSKAGMHRAAELVLTGTFQLAEIPESKLVEAENVGKSIRQKLDRGGFTMKRYIQLFFMLAVTTLMVMGIEEGLRALHVLPETAGFWLHYTVFVLIFFVLLSVMLRAVTIFNHRRK
ncbi:flavodoxin family protein [Listeria ilorinensis]|uniref:flavodoxin family protein n=1 Tax=Listeria ilorinensis TaxID=2867439 RepID=UPI001EF495C5|nr:flavodoxin family protein [Listeria ilorinensis]